MSLKFSIEIPFSIFYHPEGSMLPQPHNRNSILWRPTLVPVNRATISTRIPYITVVAEYETPIEKRWERARWRTLIIIEESKLGDATRSYVVQGRPHRTSTYILPVQCG
jgi:hypothetical protein